MSDEAVYTIGAVIRLVLGAALAWAILGRYQVESAGPSGIITTRHDRLTGRAAVIWQGEWKPITESRTESQSGGEEHAYQQYGK